MVPPGATQAQRLVDQSPTSAAGQMVFWLASAVQTDLCCVQLRGTSPVHRTNPNARQQTPDDAFCCGDAPGVLFLWPSKEGPVGVAEQWICIAQPSLPDLPGGLLQPNLVLPSTISERLNL